MTSTVNFIHTTGGGSHPLVIKWYSNPETDVRTFIMLDIIVYDKIFKDGYFEIADLAKKVITLRDRMNIF